MKIDGLMPRAGFEPATTRSSAERSPRLSYLGNFWECFRNILGDATKFVARILIYIFVGTALGQKSSVFICFREY